MLFAGSKLGAVLLILGLGAGAGRAQIPPVSLPSDFYEYTVTNTEQATVGYVYMAPEIDDRDNDIQMGFMMIMDNDGNVLFYQRAPRGQFFQNLTPFPELGLMTWSTGDSPLGEWVYIADTTYTVIDSLGTPEGLILDAHDVKLDADGTIWMEYQASHPYDMSEVIEGGSPDADVHSHVIRHLDQDHTVLWEWDSFDHLDELPLLDVDDHQKLLRNRLQHLHTNAIYPDTDGNILLSNRTMSEVIKVKIGDGDGYSDGDVMWRLGGGSGNQFTFFDGPAFSSQHDIRRLPNGNITVFDNGTYHDPQVSAGREYFLDEENLEAFLVSSYQHQPPLYAYATGSMVRLANSHALVGWGAGTEIGATEYSETATVAWEIVFDQRFGLYPASYRYYRSTMLGRAARPYVDATVEDHDATLYLNFFGHDDIESYDIYVREGDREEVLDHSVTDNVTTLPALADGVSYTVRIVAHTTSGGESDFSRPLILAVETNDVPEVAAGSPPGEFRIDSVYPNPFNPRAEVQFTLGAKADVRVRVYDILGREKARLYEGVLSGGKHRLTLNADDWASGVYIVQISDGTRSVARKAVLLH